MKCEKARMSSSKIVTIIMNELMNNNNDSGCEAAFYYASPSNKKNTGPLDAFISMIRTDYTPLINCDEWNFKGKIKKVDSNHHVIRIYVIKNKIKYTYRFKLSRQYNWKKKKPMWDEYSNSCLNKYWRVDSVKLMKIKNNLEKFIGGRGSDINIHNQPLEPCSFDPLTGYYRDGYCRTGENDYGTHTVCGQVTDEFLEFSKKRGNDLITPKAVFPGLKHGNYWCLCANRYKEAKDNGIHIPVNENATNHVTHQHVEI